MHIKTANGKKKIVMSRKEWESIGKKAGWTKHAERTIDEWHEAVDFSTFRQQNVPRRSEQDHDYYEIVGKWTSSKVPQEPGVLTLPDYASVRLVYLKQSSIFSDVGAYELWISVGLESTTLKNLPMNEAIDILQQLGLQISWDKMTRLPTNK